MNRRKSPRIAERHLVDGATLNELKEAVRNLRALTPNSALADLVEARITAIEELWHRRASESDSE